MHPDQINGLFELFGAILIWINVQALYDAKEYKGVSAIPCSFFFAWGLWNLFYYPHLQQWFSFSGALSMTVANGVWVGQMFYYARNKS